MQFYSVSLLTMLLTLSLGTSFCVANPVLAEGQNIAPTLLVQNRSSKLIDGPNRLMEQLNLSSQQKQDLSTIRQKYQGQMKQLHEQLRTNQEALRTMMSGTASEDSIRAKHTEIVQLRQQLENLGFESMLESRAVLTPDQRQQFAQLMEKQRGKMKSKMGNSMGNPGDKPPAF
jgi:Spy/CpxP family protein refolding chaperone